MLRFLLIACFFCLKCHLGLTQHYSHKKKFGNQQNAMYFYWGYNRAAFTKSNIQFSGPDYNFTLIDVAATDRPTTDFGTYLNPKKITIPQFNIRLGWYYKHRWDISLGYDHMKYVMNNDQWLQIDGYVDGVPNNPLFGKHNSSDGKQFISRKALRYENTNGLNYVSFQLNNTAPLYKTNNRKFVIHRRFGGGLGPVITQTDFFWEGTAYESAFKFGGMGVALNGGVRFDFFNRFFLLSNWSAGYINLFKNETVQFGDHYAKHDFVFGQWEIVGGVLFYLRIKNACDSCPDW